MDIIVLLLRHEQSEQVSHIIYTFCAECVSKSESLIFEMNAITITIIHAQLFYYNL